MICLSRKGFKESIGNLLEVISFSELFDIISLGLNSNFIYEIGRLRGICLKDPFSIEYRKLKLELPFFYGTCIRELHSKDSYPIYTGILQVDLDFKSDISIIGIDILMNILRHDKYIHLGFISPSGKGIKLFVKTDNRNCLSFHSYLNEFAKYLETSYSIPSKYVDRNISYKHVCFLSYDPSGFFNPSSDIFGTNLLQSPPLISTPIPHSTTNYWSSAFAL